MKRLIVFFYDLFTVMVRTKIKKDKFNRDGDKNINLKDGMIMDIELIECSLDKIELIKPLWKQLRLYHEEKSTHFKKHFKELSFKKRIKSLFEKVENGGQIK